MMQSSSELCSESDFDSQDDQSYDDDLREFVDLVVDEMACDTYDRRAIREVTATFTAHPYHGYYLRIHGFKTITVALLFMACAYLRKCTSLQDLTAVHHGKAVHTVRHDFCGNLLRLTGADYALVNVALAELEKENIVRVQRTSTWSF